MKQTVFKYFSLFMAMLIFTASVGVTRNIHYCAMHQSTNCHHDQKTCCEKKQLKKSCCEKKSQPQTAACKIHVNHKSCCIDSKETFSYSPRFVSKISKPDFKLSVTSVLNFVLIQKFFHSTQNNALNFLQSHSPPLLSGRQVLAAKQILNV